MIVILKLIVFFFLCVSAIEGITLERQHGPPLPDPPKRMATVLPKWQEITQRVDHFDPTDKRTWTMRYISNSEFHKEGGPIFIFLGGEWTINPASLMSGQVYELAEENAGYMFYTEHRYYGESFPTEDLSVENLRYLSVDQALADVIYFIDYIKSNIEGLENSQVITIGCSYSASIATWLRSKYPHAVDIAYASSGPVRAVADFYEYLEIVGEAIASVSEDCLETIRNATAELEAKLETQEGIEEVTEALNMCSAISTEEPARSHLFRSTITGVFSIVVQYAESNEIKDGCDIFLKNEGTPLYKLIAIIRKLYRNNCIDTYDETIEKYRSENITKGDIRRCWLYQTCTEFGYYHTTNSENQPFSNTITLEYYLSLCTELFGENFGTDVLEGGIKRTNMFYGSINPKVTKLVSVHGSFDPWHKLGILEDLNPLAPAIVINGSSHCADLTGFRYSDSDELKVAKARAKELIAEWIAN